MNLELVDGENEDLLKKNKKKKSLGTIQLNISMTPMSKEQMNEAILHFHFSQGLVCRVLALVHASIFTKKTGARFNFMIDFLHIDWPALSHLKIILHI